MLDRKIKFALDILTARCALLGTATIASSGECLLVLRVCVWLVASFNEDILLRLSWLVAIVPGEASLVLELLTEICERVVERVGHHRLTLTAISNTSPASPTNIVATILIFQNLNPVELVVVAIDIGLIKRCIINDSLAVNIDTM